MWLWIKGPCFLAYVHCSSDLHIGQSSGRLAGITGKGYREWVCKADRLEMIQTDCGSSIICCRYVLWHLNHYWFTNTVVKVLWEKIWPQAFVLPSNYMWNHWCQIALRVGCSEELISTSSSNVCLACILLSKILYCVNILYPHQFNGLNGHSSVGLIIAMSIYSSVFFVLFERYSGISSTKWPFSPG